MSKKHRERRSGTSAEKVWRANRDTRVGTLRETYGSDFARGFRSDAKLSTVLESTGTTSLKEYLKHSRRARDLTITSDSRRGMLLPASQTSGTIISHATVVFAPALKNLAEK
jgi:hypothetical protein